MSTEVCYEPLRLPEWVRSVGERLGGCFALYADLPIGIFAQQDDDGLWVVGLFPAPIVIEGERWAPAAQVDLVAALAVFDAPPEARWDRDGIHLEGVVEGRSVGVVLMLEAPPDAPAPPPGVIVEHLKALKGLVDEQDLN